MADSHAHSPERRKLSLSDNDIERIGEIFDRKMQGMFEVIGYDTSTPESRADIRKDHEMVRDLRRAKTVIILAVLAAVGTSIAAWAMR